MQKVFYGVSAGVISIITISAYKLTQKSITSAKDYLLWGIFVISALATFITETESVFLFLGAGIVYWLSKFPPTISSKDKTLSLSPLLLSTQLWKIAVFFTKAGAFVFGSGLAIVPFLYAGVVKEYAWLNEKAFLDAVAVAMITPGPVVITVGFIGYLVEGFSGAAVAALATFLPCYLFTILPAPYFKKYGKNPAIKAFIDGVTAASIGAIVGAVILLSKRTLIDTGSISLAIIGIAVLWKYKKVQEPIWILVAAVLGILIKTC
jgi:chromate transporter